MKVSKEKAAENRAAMVAAAGRLFRARGFDGVSLAEIAKAAGLTHGGFYGQFGSKEELAAEACAAAFAETFARFGEATRAGKGGLAGYLPGYLSERHRDRPDGGCPMAALVTDVPRQGAPVQAAFADGVRRYLDALERLPETGAGDSGGGREEAVLLLSALVGALALSRATAEADPALSSEILTAVEHRLSAALRAAGGD